MAIRQWKKNVFTIQPGIINWYKPSTEANVFQIINRQLSGGGIIYLDDDTNPNISALKYAIKIEAGTTGALVRPYTMQNIYLTTDATNPVTITIIEIYTADVNFVLNTTQNVTATLSGTTGFSIQGGGSYNGLLAMVTNFAQQDNIDFPNTSAPYGLLTANTPLLYDENKYQRQRGNSSIYAIALGSRSLNAGGILYSNDITNYNARGVMVYLYVTGTPGANAIRLWLESKVPFNSAYASLTPVGSYNISSTGVYTYMYYPGASYNGAATPFTDEHPILIPHTFRVGVQHSSSGTWTYGVYIDFIL